MAFTYKLLEVKNLNTSFRIDAGKVLAVNGVSFELEKGKVLGIVGESGSGKSVTAYSIMGILDKNGSVDSGKIIYNGTDLLKISERQMRNIRGNRISIIFQDAMTSLNPTWSIGNQLREAILTHAKNPIEQAVYDLENSIESDQQRIASMKRGLQNHPERDQLRADLAYVENKLIEDRKRLVEEREKATIAYAKLKKEKNEEYRQGKGAYNAKIALARKEYWKHYFDLAPLPSIEEAYEQQGIRLQKLRAYSKQRYVDYQQERIALLQEEFAKNENPTREELSLQRRSIKNEKAILGTAKAERKEAEKELRKLIKEYRNGVRLAPRHARKAALKKEKVAKLDFKYDCISAYKETKYSANKKALQMLTEVGITEPEKRMKQYPFELSGGMLQRCMIAMALVERPDILIADEPTTALDVTIQAQILDLLKKLQKEYGMAILIITHDLGVVAQVCDEVDIMYAGRIVERGSVEEIFYNPQHEYTKGLLKSMPKLDGDGSKLEPIQGNPVDLFCLPKGCAFSSRCKECMEICIEKYPEEVHCGDSGHAASCWKMVQRLHEEGLIDVVNGKPEGKPLIYNGAVIKQGKGVKK